MAEPHANVASAREAGTPSVRRVEWIERLSAGVREVPGALSLGEATREQARDSTPPRTAARPDPAWAWSIRRRPGTLHRSVRRRRQLVLDRLQARVNRPLYIFSSDDLTALQAICVLLS